MSSTSQKHRNFVSEPMGQKKVTELPGIGKNLGQQLSDQGYNKANQVLGKFLVMEKEKEPFTKWLKETTNASTKHAEDCHKSLSEWSSEFL